MLFGGYFFIDTSSFLLFLRMPDIDFMYNSLLLRLRPEDVAHAGRKWFSGKILKN